jgi:hypothetical protein
VLVPQAAQLKRWAAAPGRRKLKPKASGRFYVSDCGLRVKAAYSAPGVGVLSEPKKDLGGGILGRRGFDWARRVVWG